jgi:hypothetical protein
MSIWRWAQRIWISLGLAATLVFVVWSLIAYRASPAAPRSRREVTGDLLLGLPKVRITCDRLTIRA